LIERFPDLLDIERSVAVFVRDQPRPEWRDALGKVVALHVAVLEHAFRLWRESPSLQVIIDLCAEAGAVGSEIGTVVAGHLERRHTSTSRDTVSEPAPASLDRTAVAAQWRSASRFRARNRAGQSAQMPIRFNLRPHQV
jgi:hypothetical protein